RALLQNGGSRVAKEGRQSLSLVPAHHLGECGAGCPKHEPAALATETEIEQLVRAVTRTRGVAIHAKGSNPLDVWQGRTVPRQSKHDRTRASECKPAQLVVRARACVLCPKPIAATKMAMWATNNHSAAALHLVPRGRPQASIVLSADIIEGNWRTSTILCTVHRRAVRGSAEHGWARQSQAREGEWQYKTGPEPGAPSL